MRFVVLALALALAVCGKDAPSPPATAQPAPTPASPPRFVDACRLLALADIEAATKHSSRQPIGANSGMTSDCTYVDAGVPHERGKPIAWILRVGVTAHDSPDQARRSYDEARGVNPAIVEALPGLGDSAFWLRDDAIRSLTSIKGPYELVVIMGPTSGGRDAAVDLARKAIGKLP
jgi:hypothetical protein